MTFEERRKLCDDFDKKMHADGVPFVFSAIYDPENSRGATGANFQSRADFYVQILTLFDTAASQLNMPIGTLVREFSAGAREFSRQKYKAGKSRDK